MAVIEEANERSASSVRERLELFKATFAGVNGLSSFTRWLVANGKLQEFLSADVSRADGLLAEWSCGEAAMADAASDSEHPNRRICLACKESYDIELAESLDSPEPELFCTVECRRDFRKKNGR